MASICDCRLRCRDTKAGSPRDVSARQPGSEWRVRQRARTSGEKMMKSISRIACACLIWAVPAGADVVVDWNQRVAQAIAVASRPSPANVFDYAMVHVAMHDAIQAFEGRFEPYCGALPNAAGSPIAAAATAAHDVLVSLFPSQS